FNCFFVFSVYSQVSITPFATGLSNITDIKNAGDDRLFIVEAIGRIKIVDRYGNVNPVPFLNIQPKVVSGSEQGLLGLAFSPDYKNDGRFYVNYTGAGGHTHIARYHVSATNPDSADPSSEELLVFIIQPFVNHNGGCLQFGNDGYLYCALGDGGSGGDPLGYGQSRKDTLGNLLRIDVSPANGYAIPASNPFVNDTNSIPMIWSYGLRNPWRFSFDRLTHDLWMGDVGQGTWEEINFQPAQSTGGENYGWRCNEGNHLFNTSGCGAQSDYVFPVYEYIHSTANGCSVTGGYVYRGGKYAAMFGKYFFADWCSGLLQSLKKNTGSGWSHNLEGDFAEYNFGTFGEDRFGELYLGGFTNGIVYKINHADCTPTAYISDKDTLYSCGNSVMLSTPLHDSLQYEWLYNEAIVAGENSNELLATQNGWYNVRVTTADNSCTNISENVYVVLSSTVNIDFTGLPSLICKNYNPAYLTGTPPGGYFTGDGITGTAFYPGSASIGEHVIAYDYVTDYGCALRKEQMITVTECADDDPVIIVPNPAANDMNITVVFSLNENEMAEISIYDAAGKLCLKENLLTVSGSMQHSFYIGNLTAGVYTFQIKNSKVLIKEKFVIAKAK
ncbi:MAG TPA: PQQ-dependent sugar dehydrogenase, partial [Bacteroidia bacterium]|nr:PQQ-dependent sugar dehydrogenase [Bacteroidia bacterium]